MQDEHAVLSKDLIIALHKNGDWRAVLQLYEDGFCDRSLLWFRPENTAIAFLKQNFQALGLKGVYSIGCGTGLLEWLLHHSTGCFTYQQLPILGYEVDQGWWESKYSPPKFLSEVICIDPKELPTFEPKFALLFCYFNDSEAFGRYLDAFSGNCVILIGPDENEKERFCDPLPFFLRGHPKWRIHSTWHSKWRDAIVLYEKI